MNSMTAFRIHRFGGPQVLQRDTVPVPVPEGDQWLVRIHASSVNPVDYKTREGKYPLVREDRLPFTLGKDFAGVVEHGGPAAGGFKPGDAVYGFVGQQEGSFAEFVALETAALAPKPASLSFKVAAAVPLAALTAWQGLFDHGQLGRSQRVLIHAGAGGVGHLALQFARVKGAQTYVTASGPGLELVRSLGADHVIDYHHERFEDMAKDIDLVFDLVGGETQTRSWSVLKDGGAMISTLSEPSKEEAQRRHARTGRYTARPDGKQLAEIGTLIDDGRVRVHVSEVFSFEATPDALARVERGHVNGKVVIDTDAV
jgi:NADPH:quinone reductase-like Zn-dependent oxidoreductase